jgi:hypothetical protein
MTSLILVSLFIYRFGSIRPGPRTLESYEVRQKIFWDYKRPEHSESSFIFLEPQKPLLDYLARVNSDDGIQSVPSAKGIELKDLARVESVVRGFPAEVKDLFSKKLVGVSLVSGLGSSAFSSSIFGRDGEVIGGFVVLDVSVLRKKSNEWFTWRERSPFNCPEKIGIKALISDGKDNDDGVRYIFLHELAHVYSFNENLHPQWFETPDLARLSNTSFAPLSWTVVDGKYREIFGATSVVKSRVHYYADENRLPCSQVERIYENLAKTNFPALYASLSPVEDFGESFANYIHTVVLNRPFEIQIEPDSKEIYSSCWHEKRCATKSAFFSKLLRRPSM